MTNQWTTDYYQIGYSTCQRLIGHPFYRYRLQCQLSRSRAQLSIAAPFQVMHQIYKYSVNESWQYSTFRGVVTRSMFWALTGIGDVMLKKLFVSKLLQDWKANKKLYTLFSNYTIPSVTLVCSPVFRASLAHIVEIESIRLHFMELLEQVSKEPLSYSSYSPRILLPLFGWKLFHNVIYSLLNKKLPAFEFGNCKSEITTGLNYFLRHLFISAIADFITYPLETLLVRASLHGIDLVINDVTMSKPIGLELFATASANILNSLLAKEGHLSLYKGVTSLILEYIVICGLTFFIISMLSKYGMEQDNVN